MRTISPNVMRHFALIGCLLTLALCFFLGAQHLRSRRGEGDASRPIAPVRAHSSRGETVVAPIKSNSSERHGESRLRRRSALGTANIGSDSAAAFRAEADAYRREEMAQVLGAQADPDATLAILQLLDSEADQDVRNALYAALAKSAGRLEFAPEVVMKLRLQFGATTDVEERLAALRVAGDVAAEDSAQFLRDTCARSDLDPSERVAAAASIVRLARKQDNLIADSDLRHAFGQLCLDAKAAADASARKEAVAALALYDRPEHKTLFMELLATEQDPSIKVLLEKLTM